MQPTNLLIKGTVYKTNFKEFCEKRGIVMDQETGIVGEKWYDSFMKQYSHFNRKQKCKVQAMTRSYYCTKENFSNMYNCIYKNMVEVQVLLLRYIKRLCTTKQEQSQVIEAKWLADQRCMYLLTKKGQYLLIKLDVYKFQIIRMSWQSKTCVRRLSSRRWPFSRNN